MSIFSRASSLALTMPAGCVVFSATAQAMDFVDYGKTKERLDSLASQLKAPAGS
jgi:hypothetical protein